MKRKRIIITVLLLLALTCLIIIVYLPKKSVIPKPVDVFGAPRAQMQQNFPIEKPEYTAVIGNIKSPSVKQQSIKVYKIGDAKKNLLFERPFYADGFHGNDLSYTFSSG